MAAGRTIHIDQPSSLATITTPEIITQMKAISMRNFQPRPISWS